MKKISLDIHIPLKVVLIIIIGILAALSIYGYINLKKISDMEEISPISVDYLLPEIDKKGYDELKKIN